MEMENVPTIICFNKIDLISEETINDYSDMYRQCGYQTITASAQNDIGAEALLQIMENKTTVLAGPSGVGKSSIMNLLYPCAEVSTGEISKKLGRGKHTTRHSEIFCIGKETYLMDTPGFSSLKLPIMEPSELRYYFPEFRQYDDTCKFQGCLHNNEPFCMVKEGLENGVISRERYESYLLMLEEIQTQKKW